MRVSIYVCIYVRLICPRWPKLTIAEKIWLYRRVYKVFYASQLVTLDIHFILDISETGDIDRRQSPGPFIFANLLLTLRAKTTERNEQTSLYKKLATSLQLLEYIHAWLDQQTIHTDEKLSTYSMVSALFLYCGIIPLTCFENACLTPVLPRRWSADYHEQQPHEENELH